MASSHPCIPVPSLFVCMRTRDYLTQEGEDSTKAFFQRIEK